MASLLDERPVATPDLGGVAHEHHGTRVGAATAKRDAAQGHDRARVLHLGATGSTSRGHDGERLVDRTRAPCELGGGLRELHAHEVGREAEPVERRAGVRRGEDDDAVGVETDEAVTHARRGSGAGQGLCGREGALDHHRGEVVRSLEVATLEGADGAVVERVVALDDAEHAAGADHRDRLDRGGARDPAVGHDRAGGDGAVEEGAASARRELADDVVEQARRAGGRTHLVGSHETAAVPGGQPQHEVGEREVGEQGPVRHERAEVVEVGVGQVGALGGDVVQPGHAATVVLTRSTASHGPGRLVACA